MSLALKKFLLTLDVYYLHYASCIDSHIVLVLDVVVVVVVFLSSGTRSSRSA